MILPFGGFVRWPRLSVDLPYPRAFDVCQACGAAADLGGPLDLWMECDDEDQPTPVVVSLCRPCSGRIVGPHKRLYACQPRNKPWPGAMACCAGCRFLEGLECSNPLQKRLGGPGLTISYSKPSVIHVNMGRRRHEWHERYEAPPLCQGREE